MTETEKLRKALSELISHWDTATRAMTACMGTPTKENCDAYSIAVAEMFAKVAEARGLCAKSPDDSEWGGSFVVECHRKMHQIHKNFVDRGFWDKSPVSGAVVALLHSEVSKIMDALRMGNPDSPKIPGFSEVEVALARVVIRTLDFASAGGYRLPEAIEAQCELNKSASPGME